MDERSMKRQAATPKGVEKRIGNLQFEKVTDPRVAGKVTYPLPTILTSLVCSMLTLATSLRRVEERTGQIAAKRPGWMGIFGRIADNCISKVLFRLNVEELIRRLVGLVKKEYRRGNLEPTLLPVSTVAVDGKHVATLHWHDLCRVLELDRDTAGADEVKTLLAERYPEMQFCVPEKGKPYALARMHTVTLISSDAAVCIYQRPILGNTNEIGAMPGLLKALHAAYGRTNLIGMVTSDAGNTSLGVAGQIKSVESDYFAQIKSGHGDLYAEAVRVLGSKSSRDADASYVDQQNGDVVTYHVWVYDLTDQGWLDWTHARQFVRVRRIAENERTGKVTVGNRYYVCSRPVSMLDAESCMRISRGHWRCENETHWTADAILQEDRRRHVWSRHPNGVLVVAVIRAMAQCILAVARKLSKIGYSCETPTWRQVIEHYFLVLCDGILDTEAFDSA